MIQMAMTKTFWQMSRALTLALVLTWVFVGCNREDQSEADPSSPASYLKDKAFMGKLDDQERAKQTLIRRHMELKKELDLENAKAPDSARVKELKVQLEKLAREYEASLRKTEEIVRQRLKPAQPKK